MYLCIIHLLRNSYGILNHTCSRYNCNTTISNGFHDLITDLVMSWTRDSFTYMFRSEQMYVCSFYFIFICLVICSTVILILAGSDSYTNLLSYIQVNIIQFLNPYNFSKLINLVT